VSAAAPDPRVETELRRIGKELAAAFPSASRQPLRALDARAMELASSDRELRTALFRFVDVVPACRSLDDPARRRRSPPRCGSPTPGLGEPHWARPPPAG